ncbi:hypothetical protein SODG_007504 [Sodalis praecaptivus]|nr:hypothetical protein NVIRENTERO_02400 [Sodalis praecaptivus]
MHLAIAGATSARPFDPVLSIQHHQSNKLTGKKVMTSDKKSLLDRLIDFLRSPGRP